MGKTAQGAVWLNADMRSPYDYWQFWRNTEDADVGRFLKLFTDLPLDEIARLEALQGAEINEAKKVLANETTALLHGRAAADQAADAARSAFEEGRVTTNLPIVDIRKDDFPHHRTAAGLVKVAGLAKSLSEARRHIEGGGVRINDERITDYAKEYRYSDVLSDVDAFKIQFGKTKIVLVRPV
jgi:tyrosyl-tRNA synthetase